MRPYVLIGMYVTPHVPAGEQKLHVPFATLLEASWRPAPRGTFSDRPQSPERLNAVAKGEVSTEAPTKPSYVPPHLRCDNTRVPVNKRTQRTP